MLAKKAVFGTALKVLSRLGARLIDLATVLILSRLLLPADFGLVAIAMSLVSIVEAVLDIPMIQALLRLPTLSRAHCDTSFTLGALRGLMLSGTLVACAWPFANLYRDHRLFWLICVLSLGPALRGLLSPNLVLFHRSMSFWRDLVVELGGKLISFSATVTVAFTSFSYWSIAVGTVMFPLGMVIISYVIAPYAPRFSLAEFSAFSHFIGWTTAAQVLSAINWQSERLFWGAISTKTDLGLFTTSNDLANMPMLAIFVPFQLPLLAVFSNLRPDAEKLLEGYRKASGAVLAIGLPILVGQSLIADPTIRFLLGEKWLGAIPLLHWLPLSLIPSLFTWAAGPLLMSINRTRVFFYRNFIEFGLKFVLLWPSTIYMGIFGIVLARMVAATSADVFTARCLRKEIGLPIWRQFTVPWRPLVATGLMVPSVLFCRELVPSGQTPWENGIALASATCVGAVVYAGVISALWLISGRPAGLEAMTVETVSAMLRRRPKIQGVSPTLPS